MQSTILALSLAFASTQAKIFNALPAHSSGLWVRQSGSEAFQPGSNSGFGATCADAFGAGFIQCGSGNKCYNPGGGESCCPQSSKGAYPCPSESFCLVEGFCCPAGLDPQTCAIQNGVTVGSDFNTAGLAPTTPAPAPSTTATATSVQQSYSSPSGRPTGGSNSTDTPTYPQYPTTPTVTPYTGGGAALSFSGVLILGAAAVAGLL